MSSFLRAFSTILHAAEAAATIAAPIVKAVDPDIAGLMSLATQTAVSVESAVTAPGAGAQKAELVKQVSAATVNVINSILASQGKPPLPVNIVDAATQVATNVVDSLNLVANTVSPPKGA